MMGLRVSGCDNFIAYFSWEWHVNQRVTVDVPEFSCSQAKLKATEAMRRLGDAFPFEDRMTNPLLCALNRHSFIDE
jgi:hypothetical protein